MLERVGSRVEPYPILCKQLPGPYLRLFFPVVSDTPDIEDGTVVALVLLYDLAAGRTLYAHPVHAGPNANPFLKHLQGPMAAPKAQRGANGDRATLRLLEHKRALWERFQQERETLGPVEAGLRWRGDFYWALQRLYFCAQCPPCRWGTPYFDAPADGLSAPPTRTADSQFDSTKTFDPPVEKQDISLVRKIISTSLWQREVHYAGRGGFHLRTEPCLIRRVQADYTVAVFPTDVTYLQSGSMVGVAVYCHHPSREVRYTHSLSAGPEVEILFRYGGETLGLPFPRPGKGGAAGIRRYTTWRRRAWTQFWLDELDYGLLDASRNWWQAYGRALADLFESETPRAAGT